MKCRPAPADADLNGVAPELKAPQWKDMGD